MVKNLCIVQARLTSTRLPNKILQLLGNSGKSILEHVYERLNAACLVDKVVFAIPDTASNDVLARFLDEKGLDYFRGDENDVLSRFMIVANHFSPQVIIRATCDNPFVDWQLVDDKIMALGDNDYVKSEGAPIGTSDEVFKYSALVEASLNAKTEAEHEHVTPYIYRNPDKFKIVTIPYYLKVNCNYRLTVDTPEDFQLANMLYTSLYQGEPIPNSKVYTYLEAHPEMKAVNSCIEQKKV
jgi:spore coat polysaccharide biosynthesis protein SpsF